MKFKKKPIVIDAVQFRPHAIRRDPEGVCRCDNVPMGGQPHIHTLEGYHVVTDGDWIITGIAGERYPCKPDIFAASYESVNE